jgi:hypothetical protein
MSAHSAPGADAPTGPIATAAPHTTAHFGRIARVFRKLAIPFILGWIAIAVFSTSRCRSWRPSARRGRSR